MIPLADEELHESQRLNEELRHWIRNRKLRFFIVVALGLTVLGVVIVLSVGVVRAVNDVQEARHVDERQGRLALYRTCVRGGPVRAELHYSAPKVARQPLLIARERRLPILDCTGYLLSRGANPVPLAVPEQRKYVRYFVRTCRAPVVRYGRVRLRPDPFDGQSPFGCSARPHP